MLSAYKYSKETDLHEQLFISQKMNSKFVFTYIKLNVLKQHNLSKYLDEFYIYKKYGNN